MALKLRASGSFDAVITFIACGFITYNGMTAEQFAFAWIKSKFLEPIKVKFECSTIYADAHENAKKEEIKNDEIIKNHAQTRQRKVHRS